MVQASGFWQRSERVVNDINGNQLEFEGFENLATSNEEKKKQAPPILERNPNRNGQDKIKLPPDLPVKTVVLDIPEEEKICKETGEALVQIGVEVSHRLAHEPGSYYIKEIVRQNISRLNEKKPV